MKVKVVTATLASLLLTSTLAYAMPPKPEKCPSASALQSVSFETVQQDRDATWVAGVMSNNYGTKDKWTFVIGKITASDAKDARKKAVEAMKSLKFMQGPLANEQYGLWGCVYSNEKHYVAVSVNPAFGLQAATGFMK